ncbi:methylmalonyl-CoA epimerase [Pseudonocardia ailaonensis]
MTTSDTHADHAPGGALGALLTQIDHVGIAVADLDEAIAWYGDVFGLVNTHEEVNEEQGVREAMLAAPGTDPTSTSRIQLLAPLRADSAIGKFLDRNGPGLQQLAYRVTDIDAAMDACKAKGLRLLYPEARRGTANSRINFIHPKDAGGVLVELVEPAADAH